MTTPNTPPTSPSARSSVAADGVPVSISVGAALAFGSGLPAPSLASSLLFKNWNLSIPLHFSGLSFEISFEISFDAPK